MDEIKNKRGGKREGAGRPTGRNQKQFSLKLDLDLTEYVESQDNKNRFINECIRKEMQRK